MKSIQPSLLGCGGTIAIIGLVLFVFFKDKIGADIFLLGLGVMAFIALFWVMVLLYKKLKK